MICAKAYRQKIVLHWEMHILTKIYGMQWRVVSFESRGKIQEPYLK